MAAAVENGAPKTELQELQMKANQVTDDVRTFTSQQLCFNSINTSA